MSFTFEDKINIVNTEIAKRRGRWRLKAIPSIDYDDVSQLLRIHIYKQWDKWDQNRALEPWLNTVITNQMINMVRNLYGNFARPCVAGDNGKPCAANQGVDAQGDGLCSIYGKQCSQCPFYAYWEIHKKNAHDTKLPVPLDAHIQEVYNISEHGFDLSRQVEELHEKLREILTPLQYKVYTYLFIDGKSEDEVAKLMGYNSSEKGRSPGYKTISNIRKVIIFRTKKYVEREM